MNETSERSIVKLCRNAVSCPAVYDVATAAAEKSESFTASSSNFIPSQQEEEQYTMLLFFCKECNTYLHYTSSLHFIQSKLCRDEHCCVEWIKVHCPMYNIMAYNAKTTIYFFT